MSNLVDRLKPRVAKYGPVVIATVASQGFTALSLLALTLLGLGISDIYIVALQAGNGAFTGVVLGVIYPLALGRPNLNLWRPIAVATSLFQIVFSIGSYWIYVDHGGPPELAPATVATIFAAFGLGGAALSSIGVYAVRSALAGQPIFLATATLPSNAVLIVSVLVVSLVPVARPILPIAPAVIWCVTTIVTAAVLYWRYVAPETRGKIEFSISRYKAAIIHTLVLLTGVFSSTVIPTIYITAMSHLVTGTATFIFIASRIGNAIIGLLINSVILVNYRWSGVGRKMSSLIPLPTITSAVTLSAAVAISAHAPKFIIYFMVFIAWVSALAAQPVATSEINSQKRHWTLALKVAIDSCCSLASAYFLLHHPSVTGFFAVNTISQLITLAIFGEALKSRATVAAAVIGLFGAVFFLVNGQ
ncbi:hypothetical protein [Brevundimonas goettingensis]|uniref:Uncharacterized protein n=1 Tax=Brevundimonas goettingensis TaxID=2774190 RepID=A0A975GW66_9CAUL|nr:hypothetical protein [Brevundimonas goettingensis]QTC91463.1 hypothetical protein IFJ75_00560 [Brevundimonas goettingensis]